MAQAQPKTPLEILQASINGVLIETGKAFRAAGIDGGKTMAVSAMKLHSTIPYITNNFHRALDDLEAEIIRAKAVLGRDLEEMRSNRIAAESPPVQIMEEPAAPETLLPPQTKRHEDLQVAFQKDKEATPLPTILREEENPIKSGQSNETVNKEEMKMKERRVLSPPSTNDKNAQAIGLGITTTLPASRDAPATATTGGQVSSIDSLFDIPNSATNHDSLALNFDNMDFTMPDASTDTQSQSNNQTQNTEFDLSTFGNNPQDFSTNGLHSSNETSSNHVNITRNNKGSMMDNLLNMASTAGSGTNNNNNNNSNNNMDVDLDLDNMVGAEESVFDELFFGGDDDGNVGGGVGEMEHGQFDNAFFGID
ncbi:hypothetical protein DSL72_009302 [Monilinia vaccinii-corymbosi]|uniref:Uncharacterized protein n=1 Tax=Monilinia vaccinii-corymbosi TaxID=61207 RepID=A0A8A3PP54_9HELO|nr:hypothetical protein DSL72_009302 [Monilinia vaccinii-corymbosi]